MRFPRRHLIFDAMQARHERAGLLAASSRLEVHESHLLTAILMSEQGTQLQDRKPRLVLWWSGNWSKCGIDDFESRLTICYTCDSGLLPRKMMRRTLFPRSQFRDLIDEIPRKIFR